MTSSVLMRLEGPLQAWGVSSKYERRDTQQWPSKSGIVGLVANALGRDWGDDITDLAALDLVIRIDQPGEVIRDLHTAGTAYPDGSGGWISASGKIERDDAKLSKRMYLADAVFTCALGGDNDVLTAQVATALRHPARALSLGRRSCPPSAPILIAHTDTDPMPAIQQLPYQGRGRVPGRLRAVWNDAGGTYVANDQPVSNTKDDRRFTPRTVRIGMIDTPGQEKQQPGTGVQPS